MNIEWLQAQLTAFFLQQADTDVDLSDKYAKIIMDKVNVKPVNTPLPLTGAIRTFCHT